MGQSRTEDILRATIDGTEYKDRPQSREEELLIELKEAIEAGGGGGGGGVTKEYVDTQDAKKVDKVSGKGLSTNDYDNTAKGIVDGVTSALADKVDKVSGKGLSTNDYDNTAKGIVDGVTAALSGKVDKETGKGLSTNDYTNADKGVVDGVTTALDGKADADDVIDSAVYDSTNHLILFKNGTTTLFSLDAAEFVKDGMVDTVEITGGNLVITFNTDAGKQAISIPLTDIFDPANYYNKTATDNLLADKADKSTVIQFKTTTETDANNLREENGYYIVNTSDMTNLPTTDVSMGYCLEVIRYGSFSNALVVQIAYRGNPTTESPIYMRRWFNSVWTDWVAIAKKSEVTGKADKVSGATNGNFASLDANGNPADSGKKASDFIEKSQTAGLVKNDGSIDETPYVSDISGKADKVENATNNNFAALDANGNLTDSGVASSGLYKTIKISDSTLGNKVNYIPLNSAYGESLSTVVYLLGSRNNESDLLILGSRSGQGKGVPYLLHLGTGESGVTEVYYDTITGSIVLMMNTTSYASALTITQISGTKCDFSIGTISTTTSLTDYIPRTIISTASTGSAAILSAGTDTTQRSWTAKMLRDELQDKTLATSLTIGGESQTTVEDALGALNTAKADVSSGVPTVVTEGTVTVGEDAQWYKSGRIVAAEIHFTTNSGSIRSSLRGYPIPAASFPTFIHVDSNNQEHEICINQSGYVIADPNLDRDEYVKGQVTYLAQ